MTRFIFLVLLIGQYGVVESVYADDLVKELGIYIKEHKGDWSKWLGKWDERVATASQSSSFLSEEVMASNALKDWLVSLDGKEALTDDDRLELCYWYKLYHVRKWQIPQSITDSIVEGFVRRVLGLEVKKQEKKKEVKAADKKDEKKPDPKVTEKQPNEPVQDAGRRAAQ